MPVSAAWLLWAAVLAAAGPADAPRAPGSSGRVLRVGADKPFKTVAAAAKAVRDGDRVEIDAGVYKGDVAAWKASDILIRGVGGRARLEADGKNCGGKGIWVVGGRNVVVENVEFSGARVRDKNGAGIRIECRGLTLRNCCFRDNEDGILGGGGDGDVLVEFCEFYRNGHGDGQSHNIYIGRARSFTLRYSYSHGARVGHNVKSRAERNLIYCNRIMDEAEGNASYEIDLPNGGLSFVIGNLLHKGPKAENSSLVAYAMEGPANPDQRLYVVNNTMVTDLDKGAFVSIRSAKEALVANNLFLGAAAPVRGRARELNNLATRDSAAVLDRTAFDYRLPENSPARDKGSDPGKGGDFPLAPAAQYLHKARGQERAPVGPIDIGAWEFGFKPTREYGPPPEPEPAAGAAPARPAGPEGKD